MTTGIPERTKRPEQPLRPLRMQQRDAITMNIKFAAGGNIDGDAQL
jgi:hypothetical protein